MIVVCGPEQVAYMTQRSKCDLGRSFIVIWVAGGCTPLKKTEIPYLDIWLFTLFGVQIFFSKKSNIFQGHLEGKIFEILIFSSKQTHPKINVSFRIQIFRSLCLFVYITENIAYLTLTLKIHFAGILSSLSVSRNFYP